MIYKLLRKVVKHCVMWWKYIKMRFFSFQVTTRYVDFETPQTLVEQFHFFDALVFGDLVEALHIGQNCSYWLVSIILRVYNRFAFKLKNIQGLLGILYSQIAVLFCWKIQGGKKQEAGWFWRRRCLERSNSRNCRCWSVGINLGLDLKQEKRVKMGADLMFDRRYQEQTVSKCKEIGIQVGYLDQVLRKATWLWMHFNFDPQELARTG